MGALERRLLDRGNERIGDRPGRLRLTAEALLLDSDARGLAALWIVVVLAIVSGIDYFRIFWREVYRPGPRPVPREAEPLVETKKARLK